MKLREYVKQLPRGERQKFRQRLAGLHGVSAALVRKWEYWPPPENLTEEQIKRLARKHPANLDALKITEAATSNQVTGADLLPECWGGSDGK